MWGKPVSANPVGGVGLLCVRRRSPRRSRLGQPPPPSRRQCLLWSRPDCPRSYQIRIYRLYNDVVSTPASRYHDGNDGRAVDKCDRGGNGEVVGCSSSALGAVIAAITVKMVVKAVPRKHTLVVIAETAAQVLKGASLGRTNRSPSTHIRPHRLYIKTSTSKIVAGYDLSTTRRFNMHSADCSSWDVLANNEEGVYHKLQR